MQAPIPILMYHQIDVPPPRGTPLRGLVVAPKSFAWQMALLRMLGFQGLSMRDLEPYLSGEKTGRVVGITFDDGYRNNLEHALPLLQRYGHTATCYAVSDLIGKTMDQIERWAIEETLKMTAGNREEAAKILEIGARTLYRKLDKYKHDSDSPDE